MSYDKLDFLLNECGDLALRNGDLVRVTGADLIRQQWLTVVRVWKGEFALDANKGIPYSQEIFAKLASEARLEEIYRDATLSIDGVLLVQSVQPGVLDPLTRTLDGLSVDVIIDGPEGALGATFFYDGSLSLGECFLPGEADLPLSIDDLQVWFDAQDLANLTYSSSLTLTNKAATGQAQGTTTLQGVSALGNKRAILLDSTADENLAVTDTPAIRHGTGDMTVIAVMKHLQKVSYSFSIKRYRYSNR
jgi:hypothetical protein